MAHVINLRTVFRQTGPMACWFYAAKTVIFHKTGRTLMEADYLGSGPLPSAPVETGRGAGVPTWLAFGLPPGRVAQFAELFHFAQPSHPATWTASDLESTLRQHGPLWFGGHSGRFNHVVVMCGIDRRGVHYGDPATGQVATASLEAFNSWTRQQIDVPNPLYYSGR
jgi:hypothetical protein